MHPHTLLVNQCLAILGEHPDECAVWENKSGQLPDPNSPNRRPIRYGVGVGKTPEEAGGADIIGVLRGGRFLAVECKTGKATLTRGQRRWRAIVERMGGLYVVARCERDARAVLETGELDGRG